MPLDYIEDKEIAGQAAASAMGDTSGAISAFGADLASTVWNSTVGLLGGKEVSTRDLLTRVDNSSLAFYDMHKEGVESASFLAGVLAPQAATLKLLGMAKNGLSVLGKVNKFVDPALDVFTGRKATVLEQELSTLFANSKYDTPLYNQTMRRLYANKIGENIIDAAVFEGITVGVLNAHPYMEDYVQAPLSNFLLWTAVGGGIGAGFGVIGARSAVRGATGDIATEAVGTVYGKTYKAGNPYDSAGLVYQKESANIANLTALIESETNQYTKDLAASALLEARAAREEAILGAAPWLKPLGTDKPSKYIELRPYVEQLLMDPNMIGVNKIKLPQLNFVPKGTWDPFAGKKVQSGFHLAVEDIQNLERGMDVDIKTVFYRPSDGGIFNRDLAGNAATAADLKSFKPARRINEGDPGLDFHLNNLARAEASATVNSKFLDELNGWNKGIKIRDIPFIAIAPDNLPRLNAAAVWQGKLSAEELELVRYNVRNDRPRFQAEKQFIESGAAGVSPDYMKNINAATQDPKVAYANRVSGGIRLDPLAKDWVDKWIVGSYQDKQALRNAMSEFLTTPVNMRHKLTPIQKAAQNIWEKGQAFRDSLLKDAAMENGKPVVYLYRGTDVKLTTHAPIESYSTQRSTSGYFGKNLEMYQVPVENIIGMIGGGEKEILATSRHFETVSELPIAGKTAAAIKGTDSVLMDFGLKNEVNTLSGIELVQHLEAETEKQVRALVAGGEFTFEEISSRLGIKHEAAQLTAAGKPLSEIPGWQLYNSTQNIEKDYLSAKNRIIALQGNPNVQSMATFMGNLDQRNLETMHQQFVEFVSAKFKSSIANSILDIYSPTSNAETRQHMMAQIQLMKEKLGEVNNQIIKNSNLQSVDNALRHLSTSPFITYIGKRVNDVTDATVKRIIEPVSTAMKGLGNSAAALAEFNNVKNKLASLKGWRDLRIDDESGMAYIVQRTVNKDQMIVETPLLNADGTTFLIKTPNAINALQATVDASQELLTLHNLNRNLRGQAPLNDLGFYLPPESLVNKHISYILDASGKQRTSILVADTAEELNGLEKAYREEVIKGRPELSIVSKGVDQKKFNTIAGYMDGEPFTTYANFNMRHGGSITNAITPSDARGIDSILGGYESQIIAGMRKYHETYLHDITHKLDLMSDFNQRLYEGQPLKGFFKKTGEDAARTVKNAMLGVNNLNQWTTWKSINEFADMMIVTAGRTIDNTAKTFGKDIGSKEHFEELNRNLKMNNIEPIWKSYELYAQSLLGAATIDSKRAVSVANGLLGTMQLRLLEAGHAIVNALSLPVLSSAALMEGLPATRLANGTKINFPMRIMYDAARFQFHPEGQRMIKIWEEEGHLNQAVRQYTDVIAKTHVPTASKGAANEALGVAEGFQNSKAAGLLSTPADFTEGLTRQYAMAQGYLMAKHAYPGISDRGATIHAVSIADRVIGNYYAAQRPTLFQGTFGAVIGLYQTYMLSFAQSVYRGIESGNRGQLAATMLSQAGIFGMSSWPGYDQLSKFIGLHMSNQNYDLTTGTYRAVGDPMAEIMLYGFPSWLGPSLYTRGDVNPRVPNELGDLAIVNTATGVFNALGGMVNGLVSQPSMGGKLQAMMEALSLQTLSRPIARASEIVAGESVTKKGQTVATSDDVWTFNGIASRLLAVRPLEEQVIRNANNLHSFYGAADHENRQNAVNKLRVAIRAGSLTDDLRDSVAQEYLRHGGTSKGWTAVMNDVMVRTEEGTSYDLLKKLEPNSPLRRMIKDTY